MESRGVGLRRLIRWPYMSATHNREMIARVLKSG